jgi:hypothetical protein
MVELVKLFIAAGLLVGPALQPAANIIAPSAIKIKVAFILISFFPPQIYATDAFLRQTPCQIRWSARKNNFYKLGDAVACFCSISNCISQPGLIFSTR